MKPPRALAVAATLLLCASAGALTITFPASTPGLVPSVAEVPLGRLHATSLVGASGTNGTVDVVNTLVLSSTNAWYLNNTNASVPLHAKFILTASSGVSNLNDLYVGIHNGTQKHDQLVVSLGSWEQTSGSYVRLEPSSANHVYVDSAVSLLGATSLISFDIRVADDTAESAHYVMKGQISLS